MKTAIRTSSGCAVRLAVYAALAVGAASMAQAQVTLYENDGFAGRSITARGSLGNFDSSSFNDRASSIVVPAGQRWEVCTDVEFGGRCLVLRPGNYASLREIGFNDRISSLRYLRNDSVVEDGRYALLPNPQTQAPTPSQAVQNPPPWQAGPAEQLPPQQAWRRRDGERLFQADVLNVKAVMATPEQTCWMEQEQVRERANVPGAVIGAVLGGILGHQVGGGTGQKIATVGGVAAGAAVGSQVGRDRSTRDVQRCTQTSAAEQRPRYWDVTYRFRGTEHNVQMTTPPGPTVTVNRNGEPRIAS